MFTRALAALAVGVALMPASAEACSCLMPTVKSSHNHSSDTLAVEVLATTTAGTKDYYWVEVKAAFSGCNNPGDRVVLVTSNNPAACGTSLTLGDHWLVFGNELGAVFGKRAYLIGSCDSNQLISAVAPADRDWLLSREVYCPTTGSLVCANGDPLESCPVDPCTTAPPCPDGTCTANHCGGCTAEFYDLFGYQVCM